MKKLEIIIKLLVLKDCMAEWASMVSLGLMYYIYCTFILNGTSLSIINCYIVLPIWFYLFAPLLLLIVLGLINMFCLNARKQAYYMKNNNEWQNFKEELKELLEEKNLKYEGEKCL
jgi:hypothetical protein